MTNWLPGGVFFQALPNDENKFRLLLFFFFYYYLIIFLLQFLNAAVFCLTGYPEDRPTVRPFWRKIYAQCKKKWREQKTTTTTTDEERRQTAPAVCQTQRKRRCNIFLWIADLNRRTRVVRTPMRMVYVYVCLSAVCPTVSQSVSHAVSVHSSCFLVCVWCWMPRAFSY